MDYILEGEEMVSTHAYGDPDEELAPMMVKKHMYMIQNWF